ncbi:MAG TPA: class I SAM-dependent RNA methyltransferase [Ktedonobacterales bacterium]|nr:class I SAM-dependent RNA methyltransferase [Ktedonobacterales bacterium]
MLETTPTEQTPLAAQNGPRFVAGRYRVRVESLLPDGLTHGRIIEAVAPPDEAAYAAVYGTERPAEPPTAFTFIGGLPGEIVEVEARWSLPRPGRKRAKRVPVPQVRLVEVIESAPERATPGCPVFGECGGCQLQQMDYAAQLAWKRERVATALREAGFSAPPVEPAIGSASPWGYRNHMRFSVNREGHPGLTARGSHRVLPLSACPLAHPRINDALAVLAEEHLERPQVVLRYGVATGQMLIQPRPVDGLLSQLGAAGLDVRDDTIEEEMGGARFRIRLSSFFQTNTAQANRMAALVLERLPAGPDVTLVDAYCGVGAFARLLAGRAGTVLAIEESASAIRDARWNLRETPNVEIIQAKVEDVLPGMARRLDGLVIDPPRAGCQRPVLDALIARRVPRIVYVSCNPDTLARDLAILCLRSDAYSLVSVQPLDMFPQTAHIENIALLEARS